MKITFALPFASLAGGTRVVADYAAELHARGHPVTVVSQPAPEKSRISRLLWKLRNPMRPFPVYHPTTLLDFPGPRHVILDHERPVTDADVVIATWWETAKWVAGLSPAKGRRFQLLQDYGMFPHLPAGRVAASFRLPLQKLAVSGHIRDMVQASHGIDDIAVLPNSVHLTLFDAALRPGNAALRVGFPYNPAPRKNLGLALKAIRAARTVLPAMPSPNHPLPDWGRCHQLLAAQAGPASRHLKLVTVRQASGRLRPVLSGVNGLPHPGSGHPRRRATRPDRRAERAAGGVRPPAFTAEIARFHPRPDETWRGFSDAAWHTARNHRIGPATDRLLAALNAG